MSTRGALGFKKEGVLKVQYNHFDSYPTGLGTKIVEDLNKYSSNPKDWVDALNEAFKDIQLVDGEAKPTQEEINYCADYGIEYRNDEWLEEWFSLLNKAQGNLELYLNGFKYMVDAGEEWLNDKLFCEWSYIFNLDNNTLEINNGCYEDTTVIPIESLTTDEMELVEKKYYERRS